MRYINLRLLTYLLTKAVVQMVVRRQHSAIIDQMFVENRDFFMRLTPPLILIVVSRLDRGSQSAIEKGAGCYT